MTRTTKDGAMGGTRQGRDKFLTVQRNPLILITDNLTSGYNVGSLFRLADAFLAERLILCGTSPIPPRRSITKTACGTERWVPWERRDSAGEAVAGLKRSGWMVVAVEQTPDSVDLAAFRWSFPVALVVGDEMLGVGKEVLEAADAAVSIPMRGMGLSLNVATAAAIVVYEASLALEPGAAIRRERIRLGLSQRALSRLSGIAYSTISEIERGVRNVRPGTLHKLIETMARAGRPG